MKKVKFVGDGERLLPTLNVLVNTGDVIDVPDDFSNALFEDVVGTKPANASNTTTKESAK